MFSAQYPWIDSKAKVSDEPFEHDSLFSIVLFDCIMNWAVLEDIFYGVHNYERIVTLTKINDLHTDSFHITLLCEITWKENGEERKGERSGIEGDWIERREDSWCESTTISTITPVELSIEISSETTK